MSGSELITVIIAFVIAAILIAVSIMQFRERGFLLNNAFIYASKEEREAMDKKPYYRQSSIVFCLLSFVFLIIGLSIILNNYKLELLEIPLTAGIIIYAIVSTVKINKTKR
ncbi:MAG: DUF3784 domain-containing protein [Clostridia bacterium]|nr:DUF3784 domain-containing protein [Clostridia bacterium]